jgi:hypothetical protein
VRHLLEVGRNIGVIALEVHVVELDVNDVVNLAARGVQRASLELGRCGAAQCRAKQEKKQDSSEFQRAPPSSGFKNRIFGRQQGGGGRSEAHIASRNIGLDRRHAPDRTSENAAQPRGKDTFVYIDG